MVGGALPATVAVKPEIDGSDPPIQLLQTALDRSAGQALVQTAKPSRFALCHNAEPVPLSNLSPTPHPLGPDPGTTVFQNLQLSSYHTFWENNVRKVTPVEKREDVEGGIGSSLKLQQNRQLILTSRGRPLPHDPGHETGVELRRPLGGSFRFLSQPDTPEAMAPCGLAYLAAGIAFCFLTQLSRYVLIKKLAVENIRLLQRLRFILHHPDPMKPPVAHPEPVDTHVFADSTEETETSRKLIQVGAQTCFLHAASKGSFPCQIERPNNDASF